MSTEPPPANWKDAQAYAPLLRADRALFAWEWLRRDPAYRAAAREALHPGGGDARAGAARWGLHRFEPPGLGAPDARPVWRREIFPFVIEAGAKAEGEPADRFDIGALARFATLVLDRAGAEHWLLCDGRSVIRMDVAKGSLRDGPAWLEYRLEGMAGLDAPLLALRQLLALWRHGGFSRGLHPPERRAARWVMMLRAHDALAEGASQRDLAAELLAPEAAGHRWRVEMPSLRSRAQRLARQARHMAAGGYRTLLAPRAPEGFRSCE